MHRIGEHAVVLGASMGGLLAARVVAEAYERVTIVERDLLPQEARNRRGVPQGRHVHALLPRGGQIIDDLFPGLLAELVAKGAPVLEDYTRMHFSPAGHRLSPELKLPPSHQPSRAFLEAGVRARVRAMATVTVLDGHEVVGLTRTPDKTRVTGVRVHGPDGDRTLTADLVLDAMGRGARTPAWLDELGYPRPAEDKVEVDIRYLSRLVRLRPGVLHEQLTVIGPTPGRAHGIALFAYENDTWLVTVQEFGSKGSADYGRMLDLIAEAAPPHIRAALDQAEPLGDVVTHRFPANQRRRYDRLRRFPAGLLVFGDALCSFNPIYGQGMSVAALEAEALRRCLRRGDRDLARRFFRAAAKPIGVAWKMAVGADLALPWVKGPRPLSTRLVNGYLDRLLAAATHDPILAARFMRVSAFLEPPSRLMTPAMLAHVIAGNRRATAVAPVARAPLATR